MSQVDPEALSSLSASPIHTPPKPATPPASSHSHCDEDDDDRSTPLTPTTPRTPRVSSQSSDTGARQRSSHRRHRNRHRERLNSPHSVASSSRYSRSTRRDSVTRKHATDARKREKVHKTFNQLSQLIVLLVVAVVSYFDALMVLPHLSSIFWVRTCLFSISISIPTANTNAVSMMDMAITIAITFMPRHIAILTSVTLVHLGNNFCHDANETTGSSSGFAPTSCFFNSTSSPANCHSLFLSVLSVSSQYFNVWRIDLNFNDRVHPLHFIWR